MSFQGVYAVIRYVQDQSRDEPRNIGIALASDQLNLFRLEFRPNFRGLGIPWKDRQVLGMIANELEGQIRQGGSQRGPEAELASLSMSFANSLTFTPPRPCNLASPEATLRALYQTFVAP